MPSLWGEDFEEVVKTKPQKIKKIIDKVEKPKTVKAVKKTVKGDADLTDVLAHIRQEVYRILGKYAENTRVISTVQDLHEYIDKAITQGVIAVDTETNNSLEPITCKLMGLCLYVPGEKNAYVPVNHVNRETKELLPNQLTEQQIREELERIKQLEIIMHNGKFDYQVLKCTCGVECLPTWDTEVAARVLDENEKAKLKVQYPLHIDSEQEKYDIENLFEKLPYELIDPDLFALYAATDSFMTYKLYLWQKKQFSKQGNEKIYWVFKNIEMPVIEVVASMELTGVAIDKEYGSRLSIKYHQKLDKIDEKLSEELKKFEPDIQKWRDSKEAQMHVYTTKSGKVYLDDDSPEAIKLRNEGAKVSKSKSEQLASPPQLTSPTQLAILLYDVFGVESVDSKSPRGTGEDILVKIQKKHKDLTLCNLILEKRGLEKLIGTYIDKIPECVCSKDNRLHAHFNQYGAGTGRFSSSDPNLQNIPSKNYEIRLMFTAEDSVRDKFVDEDSCVKIRSFEKLQLRGGEWKLINQLKIGDEVLTEDSELGEVYSPIVKIGCSGSDYVVKF